MRASVPGKGGRRGTGRPGLGAGHQTRPARPGLLFAVRGPRDTVRPSGRGGGGLVRAGPGRAAGRLRGAASARPSAAGTRRRAGIRLRVSPREVFTSVGCDGCQVARLLGENSNPGHGAPEAGPPPACTRVCAVGARGPRQPRFPGTSRCLLAQGARPSERRRGWVEPAGVEGESGEGEQPLRGGRRSHPSGGAGGARRELAVTASGCVLQTPVASPGPARRPVPWSWRGSGGGDSWPLIFTKPCGTR